MTNDLKTKIAEAIRGPLFESDDVAEHMHEQAAVRAVEAALQAIHDAGFAVVPREAENVACVDGMVALKRHASINYADYGTLREVYAAMISAHQPMGKAQ